MCDVESAVGCAVAQADSRQLKLQRHRVRTRVTSCAICGGKNGTGGRFSQGTSVSLANHFTDCSTLIICNTGLVQKTENGRLAIWTQTHPTLPQGVGRG
jgi:hypothetical protein